MTPYQEIEATLNSAGMAYIVKALRNAHKAAYRRYRTCTSDQLQDLQAAQRMIDTTLPAIIERLLNQHVEKGQKQEWFFEKFFKCPQWWVDHVKVPWRQKNL